MTGLIHSHFNFHVWHAAPRVMPGAHVHTDIELNLMLSGSLRYFLAGAFHDVGTDELAIFWAGMPHRLVWVAPETEYYCMTLPLAWFVSWGLETAFVNRLLQGDLVCVPAGKEKANAIPAERFGRWVDDLAAGTGSAETRRIALLEVEAGLRRVALRQPRAARRSAPATAGGSDPEGRYLERIASYISRHYTEPLTVSDIAAVADLHPRYAMSVFRQSCGLSIWEYVTRLRVSHAQRLLITTDWTAERIALECGFGSASRFYAAFRRLCGSTPRAYRHSVTQRTL